jgi:hypothetical protein
MTMPVTFRRRFTIIPGLLYLNINRRSWSITTRLGPVGHTRSSTGRRTTSVNLPGRGVGYRTTSTASQRRRQAEEREDLRRRIDERRAQIRRGRRRGDPE